MNYFISDECTGCGVCLDECPIGAIQEENDKYFINQELCTECEACFYVCEAQAIVPKYAEDRSSGNTFIS